MMFIQSQFTFISLCRSFLRMLRGQYVSIGAEWWSWKSHLSCSSGWDSMSPGQVSSSNHLFKDALCTTLFLGRNWKVFFLGKNYFSLQKKVSPWYELVFLIPIFFLNFRDFIPCILLNKNPMALDLSLSRVKALLNHHGKWRTRNNKRREFKVDCPSTLLHLLIWRISWCRKGQIDNEDYGQ